LFEGLYLTIIGDPKGLFCLLLGVHFILVVAL